MIRLEIAAEPGWFDAVVRQPGLRALRELHGEENVEGVRRPGRPRAVPEQIKPSHLTEYWTECIRRRLDDGAEDGLYARYRGVCAYLSVWLPPRVSCPTVDHVVPKSACLKAGGDEERLIYDWSNYRLASLEVNGCKGDHQDVLDPVMIDPAIAGGAWFHLRFPDCAILPAPDLPRAEKIRVRLTICRMQLDSPDSRSIRAEHYQQYIENRNLSFLQRRCPFVAAELARQHLL